MRLSFYVASLIYAACHMYFCKRLKGFHWMVIWTPFGQGNPMQLERPHRLLDLPRFAGMRPVLIEGDPDVVARIPAAHTPHELTDLCGAFAWEERPVCAPTVDLIEEEERALAPCLLLTSQHEPFGRRVSAPPRGFDGNDWDGKEQQPALPWPMAPQQPNTAQNRATLGISAEQFALDPTTMQPPFLSTRRRCSRLMVLRRRCWSREVRNFARDHRP